MTPEKKDIVLIIDDDSRNTFALQLTLKSKGYKFISCSNAKDGLAILAGRTDIALVLMDMMMPEMDGYETLKLTHSSVS